MNTHRNSLRPATATSIPSRPQTARPQTAVSTRESSIGNWVVAVIEGRGVGREIGIAALEKDTGQAALIQLADCQTYVKTLHHVQLYSPGTILVPDTFITADTISSSRKTSVLVQCLQQEFECIPFETIGRKYWNDSAGLDFITQLMINDDARPGTLLAISNKYYALSAASALFKFVDTKLNTMFSQHSLRITYKCVEGTMMIDSDTAANLELIGNSSYKRSSHSLFGLLNHTFTPMAARLLRVNILAPVIDQSGLDARLDAVEEIIHIEDLYNSIKDALRSLKRIDVDKLISSLTTSESTPTSTIQVATARVTQMLNLRSVVKSLPPIHAALQGCKSKLLSAIQIMLSDERIGRIERIIAESLNEDVQFTKGGGGLAAINTKVYAVKANFDRLLDVARETYKENVGDIFELSRSLSEEHGLSLSVFYQEKGSGFWLSVRKEEAVELPSGFINVTSKGAKWIFTTIELMKRNSRMKDSLDETLIMSDKIIQSLVYDVIEDVGVLYKASEAIALLDMIWSFAHASILRPEFTGTLAIKAGRHPVLENIQAAGVFVANDTYACDSSAFQVVHGPNMSGKSTYLRQVGVMVVMATCGCFVPAEYASFRLHDALLSRLSNDDSPERSLSTFSNEMASSAMILALSTDRSLVLIDELGRGTSPQEGIGISHAIAEALIRTKSFVFFATHYGNLASTLSRYPSVINLHLAVNRDTRATGFGLTFRYRLLDGYNEDIGHYGLELARLADLPPGVLSKAQQVSESLTSMESRRRGASKSTKSLARRKAMLSVTSSLLSSPTASELRTQLAQVYEHSALPDDALATYLLRLQEDLIACLDGTRS